MVCVPTVFYHTVDEYRGETSNCILFIQFWTSSGAYPVAEPLTRIVRSVRKGGAGVAREFRTKHTILAVPIHASQTLGPPVIVVGRLRLLSP